MFRKLGSASCDITHETGGTICSGHWVLRHLISHTRQGVRLVTGIGFCGRSASCDIKHKTGGMSFYVYWVLRLVISHTSQGVRFVTGGHRRYLFLRALGSASCDITHETKGSISYGH